MNFFKPEDFSKFKSKEVSFTELTNFCNERLEREGKVCFSNDLDDDFWVQENANWKYKAILINIEPTGFCTHPKEKVKFFTKCFGYKEQTLDWKDFYECDCGVRVEAETFREVGK